MDGCKPLPSAPHAVSGLVMMQKAGSMSMLWNRWLTARSEARSRKIALSPDKCCTNKTRGQAVIVMIMPLRRILSALTYGRVDESSPGKVVSMAKGFFRPDRAGRNVASHSEIVHAGDFMESFTSTGRRSGSGGSLGGHRRCLGGCRRGTRCDNNPRSRPTIRPGPPCTGPTPPPEDRC